METPQLSLDMVLTAAGAAMAGGLVAGLVEVLKGLLPNGWHYGRAPMLLAAAFSLFITSLAIIEGQLLTTLGAAQTTFVFLLTWYAMYAAAVGTHATAVKAVHIVKNQTDPSGPDAAR